MRRILAATDFSPRSDRALRRAVLLAKAGGAEVLLAAAVDDDRPEGLVRDDLKDAEALAAAQARSLREIDGVACDHRVVAGRPFEAIVALAEEAGADLIVCGPHRSQGLIDVFVGTTAERIVRHATVPVLVVRGVPVAPYAALLAATDYSEASAEALTKAQTLGLAQGARAALAHAFDPPAQGMMLRASTTLHQYRDYLQEHENRAKREMAEFVGRHALAVDAEYLRLIDGTIPQAILECADRHQADLIVVATRGRGPALRLVLGSVASELLRTAPCDVLAVPPRG